MSEREYAPRVGAALRIRRKRLGLNQTEVAELAGTSQRTVSMLESGRAADIEIYAQVARVLGLRLDVVDPRSWATSEPGGESV